MLQIAQFDVKTGKPILVAIEGHRQPATQQIEHAYLEHWCRVNGIDVEGRFSSAKFYDSIRDSDRRRLETEGKYLVFSNGRTGYFTDKETAQLMTVGSRSVEPIYASDRNAVHNGIAYGSLIKSDGVASTIVRSARILVINDVTGDYGSEPLADSNGQRLSSRDIQDLLDKMGDGTMLVSSSIQSALVTDLEREQAATENQLRYQVETSVHQFRAASTDFPGIAKGTMSYSNWAERLGVDAILSTNDIKGADSRFSTPGIKEVSTFWVNRKSTGQYGQQTVGAQVAYHIPEATRLEINPRKQEKARQLAQVAGNYEALAQRYIQHKENELQLPYRSEESNDETFSNSRPDWLYNALTSDRYAQLTQESHIVRGLNYYKQGEWKRLATSGVSVPSAMAQHHNKLKPWEVSIKKIPHGAIVVYYRSPFPNVGVAAIAINNVEIIKQQDKEAFAKQGVIYLPPHTSKNVAITDFDGDTNGIFVGYLSTIANLPEQFRQEIAELDLSSAASQYEAGRAKIEEMISRLEQGKNAPIKPSIFPIAVKEFTQRTAPDVKPPQIIKQPKSSHPWHEDESYSAAAWRAWGITSDNPTGKVANTAMSLQALALELKYAPQERQKDLLQQVSIHASEVLAQVTSGHLTVPSDDWLKSQRFSYSYKAKLEELAEASKEIGKYADPQIVEIFIEASLQQAAAFIAEVADGPGGVNLQLAVDTPKSTTGINKDVQAFMEALQYKPDDYRQNKNELSVYIDGEVIPTSSDEPFSEGVRLVNEQYSNSRLPERRNDAFQAIFPKNKSRQLENAAIAIIETSNALAHKVGETRRRYHQHLFEDQKPTIQIEASGNRKLTFHSIQDAEGYFPWRSEGPQPKWSIRITQNLEARTISDQYSATLLFTDDNGRLRSEPMGYLDEASAERFGDKIDQQLRHYAAVSITAPKITMRVPWAQQNDSSLLYDQRDNYLEQALAAPAGKDPTVHANEMAIALWRRSVGGRKLAMQHYPGILSDRLARPPKTIVGRLQISSQEAALLIERSPVVIQFGVDDFTKPTPATEPSISVLTKTGDRVLIGAIPKTDIALPEGAIYMASFSQNAKSQKVIDMQILDLPIIQQSAAQMSALKEGRRHLTMYDEPYAVYGVREGQILVARSGSEHEAIALRVGQQHIITRAIASKAQASGRWRDAEKVNDQSLLQHVTTAESQNKAVWGVNFEVLGTYDKGQIQPIPALEKARQMHWAKSISSAVRTVYDKLSQEDGVAETSEYRIAAVGKELALTTRSGTELARFSAENGEVVSAEGMRQIDFDQWSAAVARSQASCQSPTR